MGNAKIDKLVRWEKRNGTYKEDGTAGLARAKYRAPRRETSRKARVDKLEKILAQRIREAPIEEAKMLMLNPTTANRSKVISELSVYLGTSENEAAAEIWERCSGTQKYKLKRELAPWLSGYWG